MPVRRVYQGHAAAAFLSRREKRGHYSKLPYNAFFRCDDNIPEPTGSQDVLYDGNFHCVHWGARLRHVPMRQRGGNSIDESRMTQHSGGGHAAFALSYREFLVEIVAATTWAQGKESRFLRVAILANSLPSQFVALGFVLRIVLRQSTGQVPLIFILTHNKFVPDGSAVLVRVRVVATTRARTPYCTIITGLKVRVILILSQYEYVRSAHMPRREAQHSVSNPVVRQLVAGSRSGARIVAPFRPYVQETIRTTTREPKCYEFKHTRGKKKDQKHVRTSAEHKRSSRNTSACYRTATTVTGNDDWRYETTSTSSKVYA